MVGNADVGREGQSRRRTSCARLMIAYFPVGPARPWNVARQKRKESKLNGLRLMSDLELDVQLPYISQRGGNDGKIVRKLFLDLFEERQIDFDSVGYLRDRFHWLSML